MAKLEHYIDVGDKKLRCGYTTGTCAAAAVRGAAELLLLGRRLSAVPAGYPGGHPGGGRVAGALRRAGLGVLRRAQGRGRTLR